MDVFLFDTQSHVSTLISQAAAGTHGNYGSTGPVISSDGRYIAYSSDADNIVPGDTDMSSDVFVRDRQTGATSRFATQGPTDVSGVSADGRYVAFDSICVLAGHEDYCASVADRVPVT